LIDKYGIAYSRRIDIRAAGAAPRCSRSFTKLCQAYQVETEKQNARDQVQKFTAEVLIAEGKPYIDMPEGAVEALGGCPNFCVHF